MSDTLATNTWATARLEDCCEEIAQRIDNPADSGYERFVGLEHLETGETTIRNWGSTEDVTSSMKLFTTGDVIVARRNVYLRRAACAGFDGVCSGDGIVLRANPKVCLPELLPFLLNIGDFWDYVASQADGTMSKRITVKKLLSYKFSLPSIQEQRRLAEVLLAATSELHALQDAEVRATSLRRAFLVEVFRPDRGVRDTFPTTWIVRNADELGDIQLGQQRHPKYERGDNVRPYLRVANVFDGFIALDDVLKMHFPKDSLEKFELRPGDTLLNEGQSTESVGRSAIYRGEVSGCCFQKTLLRYRCDEALLPEFVHAFFQHCLYTGQFVRMVVQTTSMAHLTAVRFKTFQIPQPPLGEQREIVSRLEAINAAAQAVASRTIASKGLANRLIGRAILGTC